MFSNKGLSQMFSFNSWVLSTEKNIYFLTLPLGLMQIENLAVKYIFANNLH